MEQLQKLLNFLAEYKGCIVSTASLSVYEINQAKASGRIYVDENSLGYVWQPDMNKFPETEEEVELFERWYPLDVDLPEEINNPELFFKAIRKKEFIKNQIKNN